MRFDRRTLLATGSALAATSLLPRNAKAQAETVLRSADIHPDGYPTVEAVKFMGDLIKQRTDGRIEVQIFPSGQLGGEKDTIEQTRFGVIDMNRINFAPFNNLIPETQILSLPFLFRSEDHMHQVIDGEIGQEIAAAFEPHDLVVLAFYDSGTRSFYNAKHAINTPEDMKGMKVRVQQSDLFIAMIQALGANATPMPFGEVYSALQTGVVDGAENNWPSYDSVKHYEVAKFYSLTEHSMSPEALVMSKMSFDKLSSDDQAIVKAAAKESVPKMRELWKARETEARQRVEAGGAVANQVDKEAFIKAMQPVYDQFVTDQKLQDLVQRIRAVG
jgi:tripartite ATP-independent transporter DctP family solute receptor